MDPSPKATDQSEDCAELDEDYFLSIGQTFSVVDAWNENEEGNGKVKKEKFEEESNHSKASSDKERRSTSHASDSKSSHDKRKRAKSPERERKRKSSERDRNRTSPERRRSPDRGRFNFERNRSPPRWPHSRPWSRSSPPRRVSPPPRRLSPPRRRSPPINRRPENRRNNNEPKDFLQELQEKLGGDEGIQQFLQQGKRIDWNEVKEKPDLQPNFQMQQLMLNQQMMPQMNPMMQGMQPMLINPAAMQFGMPPQQVPPQMMFANPMLQQQISVDVPQPVPPPMDFIRFNDNSNSISPPGMSSFNSNGTSKPVTIVREYELNEEEEAPPAPKKTPSENPPNPPNLIEMLRQKSKKNKQSDMSSKNSQVLDRCKDAISIIEDLQQSKSRVPVTCALPNSVTQLAKDTTNRSPLLANENNPTFLFQASSENVHAVLEDHPLKNIYGETAEIAQHLKLDLQQLSTTVAKESAMRQVNEITKVASIPEAPKISKIVPPIKTATKEVQTEVLTCRKCVQQEMIRQSSKSKTSQTFSAITVDSSVQHDEMDEPGGFRIYIDARTMNDRNFEQHHALEVFAKAFNIKSPFLSGDTDIIERGRPNELMNDRMIYTNPENPMANIIEDHHAVEEPNFFSTSPIRTNRQPSPMRIRPRIFDRIGEKITDHSDSPRSFEMEYREETFRPYIIPSPEYPPRFLRNDSPPMYRERDRSPGPSRRFRNKSRSISPLRRKSISPSRPRNNRARNRSRSLSRSPKRFKDAGHNVMSRRGRY